MPEPIHYAVFYDVAFARTEWYAMYKRIDKALFESLKELKPEVELRDAGGNPASYRVTETSVFLIRTSVDSTYYIICDCTKI